MDNSTSSKKQVLNNLYKIDHHGGLGYDEIINKWAKDSARRAPEPPPAAQAIGDVVGTTLLLAWAGETFRLSMQPIWVRQVAVALSAACDRESDVAIDAWREKR